MNLQEFQKHASQNVVDYQQVVCNLVAFFDTIMGELDTFDERGKDIAIAFNHVIDASIKDCTHYPKQNLH